MIYSVIFDKFDQFYQFCVIFHIVGFKNVFIESDFSLFYLPNGEYNVSPSTNVKVSLMRRDFFLFCFLLFFSIFLFLSFFCFLFFVKAIYLLCDFSFLFLSFYDIIYFCEVMRDFIKTQINVNK